MSKPVLESWTELRKQAAAILNRILDGDDFTLARMPETARELRDEVLRIDGSAELAEPPTLTIPPSLRGPALPAIAEFLKGRLPTVDRDAALEFLFAIIRLCAVATGDAETARNEPGGELETIEPNDPSAYVAMKDLPGWNERFTTQALCSKFLDKHKETIRQSKPARNRRNVHVGDWLKHWRERDAERFEALDQAGMERYLADAAANEAKAKQRKRRK